MFLKLDPISLLFCDIKSIPFDRSNPLDNMPNLIIEASCAKTGVAINICLQLTLKPNVKELVGSVDLDYITPEMINLVFECIVDNVESALPPENSVIWKHDDKKNNQRMIGASSHHFPLGADVTEIKNNISAILNSAINVQNGVNGPKEYGIFATSHCFQSNGGIHCDYEMNSEFGRIILQSSLARPVNALWARFGISLKGIVYDVTFDPGRAGNLKMTNKFINTVTRFEMNETILTLVYKCFPHLLLSKDSLDGFVFDRNANEEVVNTPVVLTHSLDSVLRHAQDAHNAMVNVVG
jgi:hypothetical protein